MAETIRRLRRLKVMSLRVFVCLFAAGLLGQAAETPKFDVADVHASSKTSFPAVRGPFYTSGRYEVRFATVLDLIRMAYNVDPERVTGGPSWLELNRFDVFAKTPDKSNAESRRQMLQALLAERFGLKTHEGSAPLPAWSLTVKKAQLKEVDGEGEAGCKFLPPAGPGGGQGAPIQIPVFAYICKNVTMAAFAGHLMNAPGAQQYFGTRLVVDQTQLKGSYDFTLRYTPKAPAGMQVTGEQIPLPDAVEKQLGLKLETANVPLPTIIVDAVSEKPTANSEEAMKSFPPLPTEFEVASLKLSDPNARPGQPDIKNGRLYVPGITLQNLVMISWEINGPEFLANAPKWMSEDRYDILAKSPEGVAIGDLAPNRNSVPVNIDALRPMLRALITERFQMVSHKEDRPMDAYRLVANKPKLKKSEPGARTKWYEGTAVGGEKNANTALGRLVTCQNVTMAQFAEMLPGIAPGYLRTNVVDATGLEGGYDFTFSFSPQGAIQQARAVTEGEAPEVNGITLFDALNKQLGLKLETVKRPVPVLVIDKIERK